MSALFYFNHELAVVGSPLALNGLLLTYLWHFLYDHVPPLFIQNRFDTFLWSISCLAKCRESFTGCGVSAAEQNLASHLQDAQS